MKRKAVKILLLLVLLLISTFIFVNNQHDRNNEGTPQVMKIKKLSNKKLFGSAVQYYALEHDKKYKSILEEQYNILTPENEMKFPVVHPEKYVYDFSYADKIVEFARKNHQKIHGHTLVWGHGMPAWLQNGHFSREEMLAILRGHITTEVKHFRGKIYMWDVVNEAFNDDGTLKNNIWLQSIGPDYIPLSYKWAHESDPRAILLYNDYGIEQINNKSNAVLNYLKMLKKNSVPIDGVGMQSHLSIYDRFSYSSLRDNINRFGKSGFKINITELDISIKGNGSLKKRRNRQATLYKKVYKACLKSKYCKSATTWGFTDKYTWEKPEDSPLLFDKYYKKKPAYWSIMKLIRRNN
jgi:endo-1,4-beta-xylanase